MIVIIYPLYFSYFVIILNKYYPVKFLETNTPLTVESYDKDNAILITSDELAVYVCYTGKTGANGDDILRKADTFPLFKWGGRVHHGFYNYANKCKLVEMYLTSKRKVKDLVFCGYRNGGAAAIIALLSVCNSLEYRIDRMNNKHRNILSISFDAPACVTKDVIETNSIMNNNIINFIYNKSWMSSSSRVYSVIQSAGFTALVGVINPFLAIPAALTSVAYLSFANYSEIGRIFSIFEDNKNHDIGDYLKEIHKYLLFHPVDQSDTEVEISRLI